MRAQKYIEKYAFVILCVVVLIVYGNTLTNKYALDDAIVITQNDFVKQGLEGVDDIFTTESFTGFFGFDKQLVSGGRYRPLSIATFAVEYELFGKNPFISHLINVLLYALVVMLVFSVLQTIQSTKVMLAFIVALLFALHPIHTEVVANIKGRDEILSLLFSLLAWRLMLDWQRNKKNILLVGATFSLFLGALSKENAIAFVFVIPASLFFLKASWREIINSGLILLLPVALFFFIRLYVLGGMQIEDSTELMNNPFVDMNEGQKYGTILFTWLWYLKLLIFPHPLTYDYYPYHVPVTGFESAMPYIALAVVILLLVIMIKSLMKKQWIGFWILFFVSTFFLMSNLIFPIGTFMNERFMFVPSLAFCVGTGYVIHYLLNKKQNANLGMILLMVFGILYSVKTISRNNNWKDDFTLFTHDVEISQNSAKGNCVAGGQYYEKAVNTKDKKLKKEYLYQAKKYLEKSLEIHPTYNDALLLYGNTLFGLKSPLDNVMVNYYDILSRAQKHANAWKNAIAILNTGDSDVRLKWYEKLRKLDSNRFEIEYEMGVIYGRDMQMFNKAAYHLERAVKIRPNSAKAHKDLAVAYGLLKEYHLSINHLKKVVEMKPKDASAWFNLGVSLHSIGKYKEANDAMTQAAELDPKYKRN